MGFDDRTADRQAEAQTVPLRRMEGIEEFAESLLRQARPGILHDNRHLARSLPDGGDHQVAWTVADAIHGLDRVDDQVQYNLLQLDPVAQHDQHSLHHLEPDRDAVFGGLVAGQFDDFLDGAIQLYRVPSSRCLPGERADALYDVTGSVAVPDDAVERLLRLLHVGCWGAEPTERGMGVGDSSGNRLAHLVRDRGGDLPHGGDPAGMRQCRLTLAVTPLVLARVGLGPPAFGEIEHKGEPFQPALVESGETHKYRDASAVLAEVFLLERQYGPSRVDLRRRVGIPVAPLRRGQKTLAQQPSRKVLTVVSDHPEKGVVGVDDGNIASLDVPAAGLPHIGADDVGIDKPADLALAFGDVAVQTSVLESDRRLRRDELQHGRPRWREHVRGEIILEVENADQLALVDQWQAEDRSDLPLAEILVAGERTRGRRVVEKHGFSCARDKT